MRRIRLALWVILALALALPVAVLRRFGRGHGVIRWWMRRIGNALGLDIAVHGTPTPGPVLWCANHVSWLDVIALGTLGHLVFVSKSEVRGWPLLGWCAAAAGTLFLRRGSGSGISDLLAHTLRSGRAVALFPEGTTGTGQQLRRFHPRLFAAAMATDAMVQPVALRFSESGRPSETAPFVGDDEFLPHLMRVLACDGLRVDVGFAEPINPVFQQNRRALARAAEIAVATRLADLPHPVPGAGSRHPDRLQPLRA